MTSRTARVVTQRNLVSKNQRNKNPKTTTIKTERERDRGGGVGGGWGGLGAGSSFPTRACLVTRSNEKQRLCGFWGWSGCPYILANALMTSLYDGQLMDNGYL